jgi:signal transduction histidine kinase
VQLPGFLAHLDRDENRRLLGLGVVSGYVQTGCFLALFCAAVAGGVLPWHPAFVVIMGLKLATNTAALVALRLDRHALALGGLNVVMDAVALTGAIWVTGDTRSPLVAVYVIEISVLALLTNFTTTVLIGALCVALYVTMGVLTARGVLLRFPTPAEWTGGTTPAYVALSAVFTAFVIAAPTAYTGGILRRLRANEARLEARTRQLIDASKEKAQFMTNITHELRTPLQGILGVSELVSRGVYGEVTPRQREAMGDLRASAKALLQLIDDLLELARGEAGKVELEVSVVDVAELLPGCLAVVERMLGPKALRLDLDVEPDLPRLRTDRAKLNQIVLNLLSNAIKFTPEGGSVALRARREGGDVCIEVADTGVGIPPAELDRVFDEFHQVDGSSSREFGGAGVGLAVVRRLVDRMGGSVTVESARGSGSTFRVRLPVAPAPG